MDSISNANLLGVLDRNSPLFVQSYPRKATDSLQPALFVNFDIKGNKGFDLTRYFRALEAFISEKAQDSRNP